MNARMSTRTVKALWVLFIVTAWMAAVMAFPTVALTQGTSAENMQILREKIKADKKLLVATNMDLTDSEAKDFWPVYEEYQKDLTAINQRIGKLIESYAADYRANTLTDEKAKKLIDEMVAIEQAEAGLKASYVPKLSQVLPPKKVARYLQIENKIRAVVKYELAGAVPLAQ
jgi:Spy/CpxP family protein refolding chaperone